MSGDSGSESAHSHRLDPDTNSARAFRWAVMAATSDIALSPAEVAIPDHGSLLYRARSELAYLQGDRTKLELAFRIILDAQVRSYVRSKVRLRTRIREEVAIRRGRATR